MDMYGFAIVALGVGLLVQQAQISNYRKRLGWVSNATLQEIQSIRSVMSSLYPLLQALYILHEKEIQQEFSQSDTVH
jgi:hypothetical protein